MSSTRLLTNFGVTLTALQYDVTEKGLYHVPPPHLDPYNTGIDPRHRNTIVPSRFLQWQS